MWNRVSVFDKLVVGNFPHDAVTIFHSFICCEHIFNKMFFSFTASFWLFCCDENVWLQQTARIKFTRSVFNGLESSSVDDFNDEIDSKINYPSFYSSFCLRVYCENSFQALAKVSRIFQSRNQHSLDTEEYSQSLSRDNQIHSKLSWLLQDSQCGELN